MFAADLQKILKSEPFQPIRFGLSDGRSVLIKHPDQVVVSNRYIYIGLAQIERSKPLATPASSKAIAEDFIWVNLIHVATVEPVGQDNGVRKTRRPRKS